MAALSHITKVFAVYDCEISQLLADYASGTAPSAPSTPSAPVVTGGGGAATWTYTIVLSNGTDSTASATGTTATGPATFALLATTPNTMTFTAIPAGMIGKIIRTVAGSGATGQIGVVKAGVAAFTDVGVQPYNAYAANSDGAGVAYLPKIKIPGIKTVEVSGTVKNSMLRGDFSLLDSFSILTDLKVSFNFAKANIDAYQCIVGGTVADTGATPNRVADWKLTRTSRFNYFRLECASVGADPILGDVRVSLPKLIADAFPKLGMAEEDYEAFTASAHAIPRLADDLWMDTYIEETATIVGNAGGAV